MNFSKVQVSFNIVGILGRINVATNRRFSPLQRIKNYNYRDTLDLFLFKNKFHISFSKNYKRYTRWTWNVKLARKLGKLKRRRQRNLLLLKSCKTETLPNLAKFLLSSASSSIRGENVRESDKASGGMKTKQWKARSTGDSSECYGWLID